MDPASPDLRGARQSINVCWQCRQRKVGCDGRRNSCSNCERLGFPCAYSDARHAPESTAPAPAPAPLPRRRGRQACATCRRRKIRCDGRLPDCGRCTKMGLRCTYLLRRRPAPVPDCVVRVSDEERSRESEPRRPRERDGAENVPLLQSTLARRSLEVFFRCVAPIPVFSFLHRATIMEQHLRGTLHPALHLALMGIATMFADLGPGAAQQGAGAVDAAESIITDGMDMPSVVKLQALVLIIQHRAMSRKFSKAFMLAALAARSAMALRLNYELVGAPFLARESCRRVVWSLYMIDTTLAAGYDCFTLWRPEIMAIQLPCDDNNFMMDIPQQTMGLRDGFGGTESESTGPLGLLALAVRVLWLRQCVLQFTKEAVAESSTVDVGSRIAGLEADLDAFRESLPAQLRLSEYTMRLHAHLPTLAAYLKVHITFLATHCILYRLALDGLKEALDPRARLLFSPDLLADWQQRCVQSAHAMADLFRSTLNIQTGTETVRLDVDLAVVVYQCARILAYTHIMDPSDVTLQHIQPHLTTCQEFLGRMFADCEAVVDIQADLSDLIDATNSAPRDSHPGKIANCVDLQQEQDASSPGHPHILSKHSVIGRMDAANDMLEGPSLEELHQPLAGRHDTESPKQNRQHPNTASQWGVTTQPRPVLPAALADQSDPGPLDVDQMMPVQGFDLGELDTFDLTDLGPFFPEFNYLTLSSS